MKPVAIFRHAENEGPGYFATFLDRHSIPWQLIAIDRGAAVPQHAGDYSGLCLMGGPMSVNDESELPWLIEENGLQAELCTVSALQETAILIEDVIAGVAGQALDRTVTQ